MMIKAILANPNHPEYGVATIPFPIPREEYDYCFYNYEQYGLQKLAWEHGEFTDRGYISYRGMMTLDELMADDPAEAFRQDQGTQFGGL